ncbi:MAG: class I SAM-dependent methyltransferase [Nitrospinota bacterium]|nr:class I SAM-dependent methyltransferase [Nitrospinota bacterium]
MNEKHVKRWDAAAATFDFFTMGIERRYGGYKRELFSKAQGRVMIVAAGTGLDFKYFPAGLDITAIDFSPKMVSKAKQKAEGYNGRLEVMVADVMNLEFEDASFDTVATACTFCSVPDPVAGLREVRRVLKPGGKLLMFEHVRAGNLLLGAMMDVMALATSFSGPGLNRRTADNIRKAGFKITREYNIYLDVVKLFEASH